MLQQGLLFLRSSGAKLYLILVTLLLILPIILPVSFCFEGHFFPNPNKALFLGGIKIPYIFGLLDAKCVMSHDLC